MREGRGRGRGIMLTIYNFRLWSLWDDDGEGRLLRLESLKRDQRGGGKYLGIEATGCLSQRGDGDMAYGTKVDQSRLRFALRSEIEATVLDLSIIKHGVMEFTTGQQIGNTFKLRRVTSTFVRVHVKTKTM